MPPATPEVRLLVHSDAAPGLRSGVFRFSASHFLASLILLIISVPFFEGPGYGGHVEAVSVTLVVLAATLAVGGQAALLKVAAALVTPVLVARWIDHLSPGLLPPFVFPATAMLFMMFVAWRMLLFVLHAPQVTREVVCAGLSTYLVLGLAWTFAYRLSDCLHPGSFATFGQPMDTVGRFDAFYFSFITLTTIAYGDITPVARIPRMLAVVEGMTGVFFMVTLISRLVSHYSPSRNRAPITREEKRS